MNEIAAGSRFVLVGAVVLAVLLTEPSPAHAQSVTPDAVSPLPGMWEGRWKSRVRTYLVPTDVIGLSPEDRQLNHDGTLEARFNFCADRAGTVHGAGALDVTKNGTARFFKPFEEDNDGARVDERTCDLTYKPSSVAGVPLTIIGDVRGADVWLFLNAGLIDFTVTDSCVERDLLLGKQSTYSNEYNLTFPAQGLLFQGSSGVLATGMRLPARDLASRRVETSDVSSNSNKFDTLAVESTEVKIRRDPLAALPLLFEDLYEADLAQLRPSATAQLESVLPFFKCDVKADAAVIMKTGGDPIFIEVMLRARLEQLQAWFAQHGIDGSQVSWRKGLGDSDRVEIVFK